jgi:hypothetical protein
MGLDVRRFAPLLGSKTTEALESEWVKSFLAAEIKWDSHSRAAFNALFVKGSLGSPYLEKRMIEVIENSKASPQFWAETLDELAFQARKSEMARNAAFTVSKRLIERGAAVGIPLVLDPAAFGEERFPRGRSFTARCGRLLKALLP